MASVTAEAIGADQVWEGGVEGLRGFTGRGIGVAVIDTGVDARHPQLRGRVALSLDFTGAAVRVRDRDENGHGTHIAGIIRDIAPGAHIISLQGDGRGRLGADEQRHRGDRLGDRQPARCGTSRSSTCRSGIR